MLATQVEGWVFTISQGTTERQFPILNRPSPVLALPLVDATPRPDLAGVPRPQVQRRPEGSVPWEARWVAD